MDFDCWKIIIVKNGSEKNISTVSSKIALDDVNTKIKNEIE